MVSTVFIAGYCNSKEGHWQRDWFNSTPNSYWVEQQQWDAPDRDDWVEQLKHVIESIQGPILVVTHSLGGSTLAEWSKEFQANIVGAFIVAPPDVHCAHFPDIITGYQQPLQQALPFTSLIVASSNDPYASIERSQHFANIWQCDFANVGDKGHINVASHLDDWAEGKALLTQFKQRINID